MKVIGVLKLQAFWKQHKRAKAPLEKWLQIAKNANWHNFAQIKQSFSTADMVKASARKFIVFNVGGNKYRLITIVNFQGQIVIVEVVLTHPEYDLNKWKG